MENIHRERKLPRSAPPFKTIDGQWLVQIERDSSQLILEALSSIKSDVGKPSGLSRRIAATSPEVLWPDCRLTLDIRFRCNEDHFKSGAIRSVPDLLDCDRGLGRIDHLSTLTKPQS